MGSVSGSRQLRRVPEQAPARFGPARALTEPPLKVFCMDRTANPVLPSRRGRLRLAVAGLGALATLLALLACEWAGWPFLAGPTERWLSQRLEREVRFENGNPDAFKLHLLGSISLKLARLQVAQPQGFTGEPMVQARELELQVDWTELLRWRSGRPLAVRAVSAQQLDLQLLRDATGRANWQSTARARDDADPRAPLITLGRLLVTEGKAHVRDMPLQLELDATFAWRDGAGSQAAEGAAAADKASGAASGGVGSKAASSTASGAPSNKESSTAAEATGLTGSATGSLRQLPLRATLRTGSALPWLADNNNAPAVPVNFKLQVGRAQLDFDGQVRDLLGHRDLRGAYRVQGPSMAAVGAPVRLTLPTTPRFAMRGYLVQQGTRWLTVVDEATVGQSRLAGEFTFDKPNNALPTLSGKLRGPLLLLQDLGPAVGAADRSDPNSRSKAPTGRVLPDRNFDLPSLRAMNANVLVDIARLDFGTSQLQSAAPLHAHVVLSGGVLRIEDLDARLAQGRIAGRIQIDGRSTVALWMADLQASGLRLEQAVRPVQRPGMPPYASGLLGARLTLSGQGRSTAQWLASADGRVLVQWTQGTLSNLLVEAAGLDIAQGLGLLVSGDAVLKVDCGAADLRVRDGRVTPQVMMVDTSDSTLWVTGALSLADERLQLVAHVQPKDFSPLTLRTPLHIDGTLAAPVLTLEKGPLLRRVVPAALLAMINPLAALIPLLDPGQTEPAAATGCQALAARGRATARP